MMTARRGIAALRSRPGPQLDFSLPAINVILLLLFFFIVSGTVTARNETEIAPPVTEDLPLDRLPRPLLLLAPDGSFWLDGSTIAPGDLLEAAASRRAMAKRDVPINLLAAQDMNAAPFLDVMATLRAAGMPVRIVTLDRRATE